MSIRDTFTQTKHCKNKKYTVVMKDSSMFGADKLILYENILFVEINADEIIYIPTTSVLFWKRNFIDENDYKTVSDDEFNRLMPW